MDLLISTLGAFILGGILIGAITERQIMVMKGGVYTTLGLSLLISCAYWFNIQFVVDRNILGYISYSLGTAVACVALAYREKLRAKERKNAHSSAANAESSNSRHGS